MAVILDDTYEVWPNCENLVLAERFLYFAEISEFDKKFSGENDCYLLFVSELLKRVHDRFYSDGVSDVKQILKVLRHEVLQGANIVLSGVISENPPSNNFYWQSASKFGAVCSSEIFESTTHVVAKNMGTKKTKVALEKNIPVVQLLWLHLSISFWYKLPEDYFKFENIGNFDIRAIVNVIKIRRNSLENSEAQKIPKFTTSESESDSESDAVISD